MIKQVFFLIATSLVLFCGSAAPQPFTLQVIVKNQPAAPAVLGTLRGDNFLPLDTLKAQPVLRDPSSVAEPALKNFHFHFSDNAVRGVYRLMLGQTTYAKVMNEPPQQLDFIFNKENIVLETDFKAPLDSLQVHESVENRVWFDFLQKEQLLTEEMELLEKEVDYYKSRVVEARSSGGNTTNLQELEQQADQKANAFNQLQMERNMFVENTVKENQNLFTARLIQSFRQPFRDGYLNAGERKNSVQQEYFSYIDFSDESLINSPVLTDKVFEFLVSYNQPGYNQEQREGAYIEAVDRIMASAQKGNERVAEFILNYLVNGFEGLGMENVLTYIAENYSDNICQTDEKTTLERKLEYQKMKPGTFVPDFTMDNIKGQPLTFSHVQESRNLIIFWASWCPHCVELLPRVKTWFRQFNPGNFEIIAISLDTSEKEWKNAVTTAGFEEFYNLSDLKMWDGKVTEDYNVFATPTMFLIDANRKILAKPETFEELLKNAAR